MAPAEHERFAPPKSSPHPSATSTPSQKEPLAGRTFGEVHAARRLFAALALAFSGPAAGCEERTSGAPEMRDGGIGTGPLFDQPSAVACLGPGLVLVADRSYEAMLKQVELGTGRREPISGRFKGRGPYFTAPKALAVHTDRHFAYLLADEFVSTAPGESGPVMRVDLSNGDRVVISGPQHGSGPGFGNPLDLALLPDGERALIVDEDVGLFEVHLGSGARTVVARKGVDLEPLAGSPLSVALDTDARVWISSRFVDAISGLDLTTTKSAVLSSTVLGAGPSFGIASAIHWSSTWGALAVVNAGEGLMAVAPDSGDRTWLSGSRRFSGEARGAGAPLENPTDVCVDETTGEAIVADAAADALLGIDRVSGDRRILSY